MTTNKKRTVFLDRDGTLVKAYTNRPANTVEEIELLPGVAHGLTKLKTAGYLLVVVTNQGGIGMGHMSLGTLALMNERLNDLLVMAGAPAIDAIYWCPHSPPSTCSCRKPKPGMLLEAAKNLNIDIPNSYMIGDDVRDMEAAQAAGLRKKVMVVSDRYVKNDVADVVCPTFIDAARAVVLMGAHI